MITLIPFRPPPRTVLNTGQAGGARQDGFNGESWKVELLSIFDPPLGALEQLEMSSCLFKEHPTDLIYNVKGRVI